MGRAEGPEKGSPGNPMIGLPLGESGAKAPILPQEALQKWRRHHPSVTQLIGVTPQLLTRAQNRVRIAQQPAVRAERKVTDPIAIPRPQAGARRPGRAES